VSKHETGKHGGELTLEALLAQDQRKYERYRYDGRLTIQAHSPKLNRVIQYDATGLNVSQGGILLKSRADFEEDTNCELSMTDKTGKSFKRTGLIRRVESTGTEVEEGHVLYGIQFATLLAEEELGLLMD